MIRIRSSLSVFLIPLRIHMGLLRCNVTQIAEHPVVSGLNLLKPSMSYIFPAPLGSAPTVLFSSSTIPTSESLQSDVASKIDFNQASSEDDDEDKEDDENDTLYGKTDFDDDFIQDVKTIMDIVHEAGRTPSMLKDRLECSNIKVSRELVSEVLSRIRNDWEAAFTFFLWADKQSGYAHSTRQYHSMISILGKMRKFDTAWSLIEEMRGGDMGPCLVTPQTLTIMIRRYSAVHDVAKAIGTFYSYKRFKFDIGVEAFQDLLSALCRYKNVQDAEPLLICNKSVFPLNTKSFNIILNGWCNGVVSPRDAERVWEKMSKHGIKHDVYSYASMISCYSKSSKLYKVRKLFDQMKATAITPDRKVYNAVIHALAKGRHFNEAINLMRTMEENGVSPNAVTYNSLIKPLCKVLKMDEARQLLDEMSEQGLFPTTRTYHAFIQNLRTAEEVLLYSDKMKRAGCHPTSETYTMLIRKFCRWRQLENALKFWREMRDNGVNPDRSSYVALIHGLFLNGKLEEAYKHYQEMKEKGFVPEPKTDEMLQAWLSGKSMNSESSDQATCLDGNESIKCPSGKNLNMKPKNFNGAKDFLCQPETRNVIRERGFSLW